MSELKKGLSRRQLLASGAAMAGAMSLPLGRAAAADRKSDNSKQLTDKPNVVFIMADDLGYADLGCYGARTIKTPHLDKLASEGMQLFQGYSNSAVCSATRTALITGRYQYRLRYGLEEPGGSDENIGLPSDIPTMPSQFRELGYRTALLGKWHLGMLPNFGPLKSGYDRFFGIPTGGADYFKHDMSFGGKNSGNLLTEGEVTVEDHGYMTELLGDRAVQEINEAAQDKAPLFLSLHFTAPHWPWEGPEDEVIAKTVTNLMHWDGGNLTTYNKMVENMDANIGKVLNALEQNGLADNTLVVFTSDNGGERFSDTWPFVGAKTELLEGGIRVPIIARWPASIKAGSTSEQVMVSMDFLPTLLAATGATPDTSFPSDGENLLGVLTGDEIEQTRQLFWRYKSGEQKAVRDGDWKYLKILNKEYLFNLAEDQRERADLKDKFPDKFASLKADFAVWDKGMLPYTDATSSHSATAHFPDRYHAENE